MFSKIISLSLIFILTTTTAFASFQESFKVATQNLNYALTVEWDQKDISFYNQQVEEFKNEVTSLRASGMTNDQMIKTLISEVKDEKLAQELTTLHKMVSVGKMTEANASIEMIKILERTQSTGASWSDRTALKVLIPTFVLIIAAGTVWSVYDIFIK